MPKLGHRARVCIDARKARAAAAAAGPAAFRIGAGGPHGKPGVGPDFCDITVPLGAGDQGWRIIPDGRPCVIVTAALESGRLQLALAEILRSLSVLPGLLYRVWRILRIPFWLLLGTSIGFLAPY